MVRSAYSVWIISLNIELKDVSTPLKPQLGCLTAVQVRSDQCQSVFDEVFQHSLSGTTSKYSFLTIICVSKWNSCRVQINWSSVDAVLYKLTITTTGIVSDKTRIFQMMRTKHCNQSNLVFVLLPAAIPSHTSQWVWGNDGGGGVISMSRRTLQVCANTST